MQFRAATAISGGLHAAVLLWALVSFTGHRLEATPVDSLPVDLVSEKDFSQMTRGIKKAPKIEMPKPLVEKIAEAKPVEEPAPKITEKAEVKPTAQKTPEPQPMPKPDPIAEKLKKQDEHKEAKEQQKPLPPKKPVQQQPKFDADKIAALLDRRAPQRLAATGEQINSKASLGSAAGTAAQLSQSEIEALRRRITSCWTMPVGAEDASHLKVVFRVIFRRDGTIERGPDAVEGTASPFGPVFAESGKRAILQCQPYTMLNPAHYDNWKDIEIEFSPRDMF
jgi:outer membrane biosynthesis protein TonB